MKAALKIIVFVAWVAGVAYSLNLIYEGKLTEAIYMLLLANMVKQPEDKIDEL